MVNILLLKGYALLVEIIGCHGDQRLLQHELSRVQEGEGMTAWMKTNIPEFQECPACHFKTMYPQRAPTGKQIDIDDVPEATRMRCRHCGYEGNKTEG